MAAVVASSRLDFSFCFLSSESEPHSLDQRCSCGIACVVRLAELWLGGGVFLHLTKSFERMENSCLLIALLS